MDTNLEKLSKDELDQKMAAKNIEMLGASGALESLVLFNLENFAYRYLEVEGEQSIKTQNLDSHFWVESVETDILVALKWKNPSLKKELIDLCKIYPGKRSQEISLQLKLGTIFEAKDKVRCYASINWDFPDFKDEKKRVYKTVDYTFSDGLELRNKHAFLLEQVCEIF